MAVSIFIKRDKIMTILVWRVLPLLLFFILINALFVSNRRTTPTISYNAPIERSQEAKESREVIRRPQEANLIDEPEEKVSEGSIIDDHGFWVGKAATTHHYYDTNLAKALIEFLKKEKVSTVLDLGAGMGMYAREIMAENIFISCYDGNPNTIEISEGRCATADLSKPIHFVKYDWVISFEVGEHIPSKFENIFLENLNRVNKKGIVLSWAVEGQGGHGHVNERSNQYIKNKVCSMGYTVDAEDEQILRMASTAPWFKHTIMVFRRIVL